MYCITIVVIRTSSGSIEFKVTDEMGRLKELTVAFFVTLIDWQMTGEDKFFLTIVVEDWPILAMLCCASDPRNYIFLVSLPS